MYITRVFHWILGSLLSCLRSLFVIALGNFIFPYVPHSFLIWGVSLTLPLKGFYEPCVDCFKYKGSLLRKRLLHPYLEQREYTPDIGASLHIRDLILLIS